MVLAVLTVLLAQDPSIDDFVRRLDADGIEERDSAQQMLEFFGRADGEVLAHLEDLAATATGEAKTRLEIIVERLTRISAIVGGLEPLAAMKIPDARMLRFVAVGEIQGWLLAESDTDIELFDVSRLERRTVSRETGYVETRFDAWAGRLTRRWVDDCGIDPLLLARAVACLWATQRNDNALAFQLQEATGGGIERFHAVVEHEVAWALYKRADDPRRPRSEVLALWKAIAALNVSCMDIAARKIVIYERLIAEDRVWREPIVLEVATLPLTRQVDYWVHHLRDLGSGPEFPGWNYYQCADGTPSAVERLRRLGWVAVPRLLGLLDDDIPTRFDCGATSGGVGGSGPPRAVRVNDIARELVKRIVGRDFSSKADGDAWWSTEARQGADAWYGRLLEGTEAERTLAAHWLLKRDAGRHLPRLLKVVAASPIGRDGMLRQLEPHLTRDDAPLLRQLLADDLLETVVIAARALLRITGSDEGLRAVAKQIGACTSWAILDALKLLQQAPEADFAISAVLSLLEDRDPKIVNIAIDGARGFRDPRIAEALVNAIDDDRCCEFWDADSCPRYTTGDHAAASLCVILGLPDAISNEDNDANRAAAVMELKAWWALNNDTIDWTKLGEPAKE